MQAAEKRGREQQRAIVMNGGIAEVRGDRVPAVGCVDAFEVLGHFSESFIPTDSLPTLGGAPHRVLQPVLIEVKVSERSSLRADVAAAERVVFVAADVEEVSRFEF